MILKTFKIPIKPFTALLIHSLRIFSLAHKWLSSWGLHRFSWTNSNLHVVTIRNQLLIVNSHIVQKDIAEFTFLRSKLLPIFSDFILNLFTMFIQLISLLNSLFHQLLCLWLHIFNPLHFFLKISKVSSSCIKLLLVSLFLFIYSTKLSNHLFSNFSVLFNVLIKFGQNLFQFLYFLILFLNFFVIF